jgi:hypothetical protein
LEKVTPSVLISTIYFAGVKSKTIELQREIYDKFNVQEYPKLGFGTDMSSMDFQNFLWIMNNCSPKEINPEIAKNVKENSKGSVNAEVIVFLNSKIIPLEPYSIQVIVDAATEGKIINFSLYDGIAFSKETYRKLGEPNMKDLFSAARKNRIPIQTLTVSSIVDNTKTYSLDGKDLFWQSGGEDHEKKFWDKCEEVLVRGMYEDRSIEH